MNATAQALVALGALSLALVVALVLILPRLAALARAVAVLEKAVEPPSVIERVKGRDVVSGVEIDGRNLRGAATYMLFLSPGCSRCEAITEKLPEAQERLVDVALVIVVEGDYETTERFAFERSLPAPVLADRDVEAAKQLEVNFAPQLVVIEADGTFGARHELVDLEDVLRVIDEHDAREVTAS